MSKKEKKNSDFQKKLFEAANDEDFKKIYPGLKSAEKEYLAAQAKKPFYRSKAVRRLALTASLVIIAIFSWQLFTNNSSLKSTELFATFYEPYPMVLSFRGENDLIAEAVNSYIAKDFEMVIKSMDQLILIDSLGYIPYMYLGVAYLELDNPDKAIENFEVVSDSENPIFRQQANWYIALTYLKANEPEKAKNVLSKLTEETEAIFHTDSAREILDQLEHL